MPDQTHHGGKDQHKHRSAAGAQSNGQNHAGRRMPAACCINLGSAGQMPAAATFNVHMIGMVAADFAGFAPQLANTAGQGACGAYQQVESDYRQHGETDSRSPQCSRICLRRQPTSQTNRGVNHQQRRHALQKRGCGAHGDTAIQPASVGQQVGRQHDLPVPGPRGMQDAVKKTHQHQSPADAMLATQRSQLLRQLQEVFLLLRPDPGRRLIQDRSRLPGVGVTVPPGLFGVERLARQHRCRVEIRRACDGTQPCEKDRHVATHAHHMHRIVTFSAN